MRTVRFLALLGVVTALLAIPDQTAAQTEIEITPFAGGTFFMVDPPSLFAINDAQGNHTMVSDGSFSNALALGLNLGLRFSDRYALEAMGSWVPTKLEALSGLNGSVDATSLMYSLSFAMTPWPEMNTPFFFGIGVGGETFSYDSADMEGHSDFMMNLFAGLMIPVNDLASIRIEARDCFTRFDSHTNAAPDEYMSDVMITAGVTFKPFN